MNVDLEDVCSCLTRQISSLVVSFLNISEVYYFIYTKKSSDIVSMYSCVRRKCLLSKAWDPASLTVCSGISNPNTEEKLIIVQAQLEVTSQRL